MANNHENYYTKRDADNILRLRQMQKELPVVCSGFFRSVSQTTSTLTRLAYAYDFKLFFSFLCDESPDFADYKPSTIPAEALNSISGHDIENFY